MSPKFVSLFLGAAVLVACGQDDSNESPTPTATPAVIDLVENPPTAGENALVFTTDTMVIRPGEDKTYCFVAEYAGGDVGIKGVDLYQAEYGHHVILLESNLDPEKYPAGSSWDCTDPANMVDAQPIFIADSGAEVGGTVLNYVDMEDGWAFKLNGPTHVLIQSHYINTEQAPIRVQDSIVVRTVPTETVSTWVAPYSFAALNFSLPSNQTSTYSFTCTWDRDATLMFLGGHMHEWGTKISISMTHADGTVSEEYKMDPWKAEYRDVPPSISYEKGSFLVKKGESFTTTCTWFNDTDRVLEFPYEMCVSFGAYYPYNVPFTCTDDE